MVQTNKLMASTLTDDTQLIHIRKKYSLTGAHTGQALTWPNDTDLFRSVARALHNQQQQQPKSTYDFKLTMYTDTEIFVAGRMSSGSVRLRNNNKTHIPYTEHTHEQFCGKSREQRRALRFNGAHRHDITFTHEFISFTMRFWCLIITYAIFIDGAHALGRLHGTKMCLLRYLSVSLLSLRQQQKQKKKRASHSQQMCLMATINCHWTHCNNTDLNYTHSPMTRK